jgi:DNA-directed RNA polymerase subunit beta'
VDEQSGLREKVMSLKRKIKQKFQPYHVSKEKTISFTISLLDHILIINDGDTIQSGQILVKIPRVMGRSRDITGGLTSRYRIVRST